MSDALRAAAERALESLEAIDMQTIGRGGDERVVNDIARAAWSDLAAALAAEQPQSDAMERDAVDALVEDGWTWDGDQWQRLAPAEQPQPPGNVVIPPDLRGEPWQPPAWWGEPVAWLSPDGFTAVASIYVNAMRACGDGERISGWRALYLAPPAAAPIEVTDAMVNAACVAYGDALFVGRVTNPLFADDERAAMRAAIDAALAAAAKVRGR